MHVPAMQSTSALHAKPSPHLGHEPPQSTSVSSPFFRPSSQVCPPPPVELDERDELDELDELDDAPPVAPPLPAPEFPPPPLALSCL
jgi:hypothetical protein